MEFYSFLLGPQTKSKAEKTYDYQIKMKRNTPRKHMRNVTASLEFMEVKIPPDMLKKCTEYRKKAEDAIGQKKTDDNEGISTQEETRDKERQVANKLGLTQLRQAPSLTTTEAARMTAGALASVLCCGLQNWLLVDVPW